MKKSTQGVGSIGTSKSVPDAERAFINPSSGPRIITPDSLNDADRKVPAALVLPAGKFFFGFKYIPYDASKSAKKAIEAPAVPQTFSGEGSTLKRRATGALPPGANGRPVTPTPPVKEEHEEKADPWANLGGGNTLSNRGAKKEIHTPKSAEVIDATMLDSNDFTFGEDDDEDDDGGEYDDVIEIDSD